MPSTAAEIELKAAAELCQSRNGIPQENDWELAEAALKIATHYLTANADSDIEVTEEWLRSVGFTDPPHKTYKPLIQIAVGDAFGFTLWYSLTEGIFTIGPVFKIPVKTRDAVRRLCESLGIALLGGKEGE